MRNEALQGAVTTVERAYGQLAVAPFTPSWRNDYMLNTMLHHPWGPIMNILPMLANYRVSFPTKREHLCMSCANGLLPPESGQRLSWAWFIVATGTS